MVKQYKQKRLTDYDDTLKFKDKEVMKKNGARGDSEDTDG
jgi:hypothetical protein